MSRDANGTIRPATAADRRAVTRIMYLDPAPELLAICGSTHVARRAGAAMVRHGLVARPPRTRLIERDAKPVGLVETWHPGEGTDAGVAARARAVGSGVAAGGPGVLWRFLQYERAKQRVDSPRPGDSLYIAHLNVHPASRGGGLGQQLLSYVETLAVEAGLPSLSLDVYVGNPAERLYLRSGFEVVAEKRDAAFERLTGLPGYRAMVKKLQ